jgi:beta-lactamase superfamily II metal-dependent hydrolase
MFKLHILNVGHGDCIVIEFPSGRLTVVDINYSNEMDEESINEILVESKFDQTKLVAWKIIGPPGGGDYRQFALTEAKYGITLTNPLDYISAIAKSNRVYRFISTHPHKDHLTGLSELKDKVGIANAWIVENSFAQEMNKLSERQKSDWALYEKLKTNSVTGVNIVRPLESNQQDFWAQDGIHILAPNNSLIETASKHNDISYVLLIKYGALKFVLGGDAEEKTWRYIVENHAEAIKGVSVLKASHHGRDSGYYQEAVKLMAPRCVVVSVGKKPETDATNKYKQYSPNVWSTRWCGTITFTVDGDKFTYNKEFNK